MKYSSLTLLLFLSGIGLSAQNIVPGYYITQTNDTVETQIKLKRGAFNQLRNDFAEEVELVEGPDDERKFTPAAIKEYGFTLNNTPYHFVSKPTSKGKSKFLTPVALGPKTSLYQYGMITSGGSVTANSSQVFYTFEKADGTYLFLRNILNKNFRAELKTFYKDNAEAQEVIDTKLKYWLELRQDLVEIVNAVNR